MEEVHRTHKDVAFGWVQWLAGALGDRARAHRAKVERLWVEGGGASSPLARPDDAYRLVRMAFGPKG